MGTQSIKALLVLELRALRLTKAIDAQDSTIGQLEVLYRLVKDDVFPNLGACSALRAQLALERGMRLDLERAWHNAHRARNRRRRWIPYDELRASSVHG